MAKSSKRSKKVEPDKPENQIEFPRSENNILSPGDSGDSGQGDWLTSYADMMTLIACFFILMTAFANYEQPNFNRVSKAIANHFTGHEKVEEKKDELQELLKDVKNHTGLKGVTDAQIVEEAIILTFSGSALFDSGSAEIRPEVNTMLDNMVDLIKKKNKKFKIIVEGHTDNVPIRKDVFFKSNWELSGARASRIITRFEDKGFDSKQLLAIGFGSTRPLKPNMDKNNKPIELNQQLNRRVVFKIIAPHDEKGQEKLGLGLMVSEQTEIESTPLPPKK